MQFQEAARFFANTKRLIEKVKEAKLINSKYEEMIHKLADEQSELRNNYELQLHQIDVTSEDKINELCDKILDLERKLKRSEDNVIILKNENKTLSENFQTCLTSKTELELKLKTYETESSLQICQTELALNRLNALRSQLNQIQSSNDSMEEFLARFKSSVSTTKSNNQRLQRDKSMLLQKLNEAKIEIASLQDTVSKLTAEKEAFKCQVSIEGKIGQYAKDYYSEQACTFERIKQRVEALVLTVEGTMASAEQSGELFNKLRKMLNEANKLKHSDNVQEDELSTENSVVQDNIVETEVAMGGSTNLSEYLNVAAAATETDDGREE